MYTYLYIYIYNYKGTSSNKNVKPNKKKRTYKSNKYIDMCRKADIHKHEDKHG